MADHTTVTDKHLQRSWTRYVWAIVPGMAMLAGLILISRYNFWVFHILAEGFSIVIAVALFLIVWNTWNINDNGYLKFMGIAFFFIGGLDAIHTLTYKGMNLMVGYDANLPTQLWIVARFLQTLTFVVAPAFLQRKVNRYWLVGIYTTLTIISVGLIFARWFPDCYIEGQGLTQFKIASEYLIIVLLSVALLRLFRQKNVLGLDITAWIAVAIVFNILSELVFTFYVSVYDLSNIIGHIFKIIAFYCIYYAIIKTGIQQPLALLFRNLQQRETLYHQMFEEHSAVMLLIEPTSGAIIEANSAAIRFYGYPLETLQHMTIDQINTLPNKTIKQISGEVLRHKQDHLFFQHRLALGEVRDVEVYSIPIQVDAQTLLYEIIHDITDRKNAETALRESEKRYRSLFENMMDAVLIADDEARYVEANPAGLALLGYSAEEFKGKTVFDVTPIPDRELGMQLWKDFIRQGKQEGEYTLINKKGESILTDYIAISNVLPGLHVAFLRNISKRKKAELAQQESDGRYQRLVENLPDLIYRYEFIPKNCFTYVSSMVVEITGYTANEHYADPDLRLKLVHPDDRHLVENLDDTGDGIQDALVLRWIKKDGTVIWVEQRNVSIYDTDGRLAALEVVVRDITEQVQMQQAQEREMRSWENLSGPGPAAVTAQAFGVRSLAQSQPQVFADLAERYAQTLEHAWEQKGYRVQHPIADELQGIAEHLGRARAGPRDVVQLHITALKNKGQNVTLARAKAYAEEGRLLIVELMGYLTSYYRKYSLFTHQHPEADTQKGEHYD